MKTATHKTAGKDKGKKADFILKVVKLSNP